MANRKNTPWDAMAERVAELLKHQLNKPAEENYRQEQLGDALEKLIAQQQQTNEQLQKLHRSTEAQTQEFRNWQASNRRSRTKTFLSKMALEIPPVVIAVLLAFGINSWWQQRRADLVAEKAYRNIMEEVNVNLYILNSIVEQEERMLRSLEQEIQEVKAGTIYPDSSYGRGFITTPMQDAAWQMASITNSLASFEDTLILDLSRVYELAHFQEEEKRTLFALDFSQAYREETLLPFLRVNRNILSSHINSTRYSANVLQNFLEKYGELNAEAELDE